MDTRCECQNCDWTGPASDLVPLEEAGIFEIVAPGEVMPHGRCPQCGAVAHDAATPDDQWRNLALQFDGHRMEAMSMLRFAVRSIEEYATARDILRGPLQTIKVFLATPPLSGEEVLARRIADSTPPEVETALRTAYAAIHSMLDQIGQMRGMFKDEDGTIQNAVDDGDAAIEDIAKALAKIA